jgi:beta-mannosidase
VSFVITHKISDWTLHYENEHLQSKVPCSLYSVLLEYKKIAHPYEQLNEKAATVLSEKDSEMTSSFVVTEEMLSKKHLDLVFYGLDTLCDVYVNGIHVLYAYNMHRAWRIDVKNVVKCGENDVRLHFHSPSEYIARKNAEHFLFASNVGFTLGGIGHIRKSSCMFGWDWGPILPDMGLYRDVTTEAYDVRMETVEIRQIHENGKVTLSVRPVLTEANEEISVSATLISPDGVSETYALNKDGVTEIAVENPKLWWPNGLGDQPLYTLHFEVFQNGKKEDSVSKTIGLRTLTVSTAADQCKE